MRLSKRLGLVAVLFGIVLLAACGGEAEETPVPTDTPAAVENAATAVPTSSGSPQAATAVPAEPTAEPPINTPRPTETPVPVVLLPSEGLLEVRITDAPRRV